MSRISLSALLIAVLSLGAPAVASAADLAAPPIAAAPEQNPYNFLFGASVTSDYVSRGISQTNHNFAVQGTAEVDYNQFYAGFFISNVDPSVLVGAHTETDWSLGFRPKLGPVSLDLGYVWYIYDVSAANGSEVYAKASINPIDPLTLGASVYVNPTTSAVYTEANAAVTLPANFKVSGAVGRTSNNITPYTSWNAGISWNPIAPVTLDLRYYGSDLSGGPAGTCATVADAGGNACGNAIVGTLSFATDAKTLGWLN